MIRIVAFILGLLMVFGAVGSLDVDPNANFVVQCVLALVGLSMMSAAVPTQEV